MKPQSRPALPSPKIFFNPVSKSSSAQGLVEFALALPILLLLIMGIIEFGRLLFVDVTVASASREAARYGSGVGLTAEGIPHYQDCAGMLAAAKRVSSISGIDPANIKIMFDHGPGTPIFAGCQAPDAPVDSVQLGDRVIVRVSTTYHTIVPLVNIPPVPLRSENSHTIVKEVQVKGTPLPSWTPWPTSTKTPTMLPSNTPIVPPTITSTPTITKTATITLTPTITPTATATCVTHGQGGGNQNKWCTATPTSTLTRTVTQTPTATETSTPTQTVTGTLPPTPTATPLPACSEMTLSSMQYINSQGIGVDEAIVLVTNTGTTTRKLTSLVINWRYDTRLDPYLTDLYIFGMDHEMPYATSGYGYRIDFPLPPFYIQPLVSPASGLGSATTASMTMDFSRPLWGGVRVDMIFDNTCVLNSAAFTPTPTVPTTPTSTATITPTVTITPTMTPAH